MSRSGRDRFVTDDFSSLRGIVLPILVLESRLDEPKFRTETTILRYVGTYSVTWRKTQGDPSQGISHYTPILMVIKYPNTPNSFNLINFGNLS